MSLKKERSSDASFPVGSEGRRGRGRPARDPRDAAARQRLIRAGLVLLTERGYLGAGISEVLQMAEAPKGCFYHYFRDKEDYGMALIDAYQEFFAGLLDRCLGDETRSPLDGLNAFVAAARAGMAKHGYRRGCLVGNLGQEVGVLPQALRERLIAVFGDWQRRMADCLRAAQSAGQVGLHHDADALSRFFWIGWEGAVLRAKLERRPEPLDDFARGFLTLLER